MSLPSALGIFEPLPMSAPYVCADPGERAIWPDRLAPGTELRVGLAWRGSPANQRDRDRSITLESLLPLLDISGLGFYSLQIGRTVSESAALAAAGVIDFTPQITDFADTAALASELDLIISVDTAVAHLAGALGRPVWTLLPFAPDWRWGLEGESTPWYPTMRLFRKPTRGDWGSVLQRVGEALEGLAGSGGR